MTKLEIQFNNAVDMLQINVLNEAEVAFIEKIKNWENWELKLLPKNEASLLAEINKKYKSELENYYKQ